jgi:hypothetical protein
MKILYFIKMRSSPADYKNNNFIFYRNIAIPLETKAIALYQSKLERYEATQPTQHGQQP